MADVREPRAPRPLARDTDPWADRVLCEHWRSLDSMAKLRILSEQYRTLKRLSLAGLALRYPDDSAADLDLRAACLRLGREAVEHWSGRKLRW
jgi:hypothetical protein